MPDCQAIIERLNSEDRDEVREAAFQVGEYGCEEAVPILASLLRTGNLGVQEAADRAMRKIGGPAVVHAVIPLLREDDAPARNLGMDILRHSGADDIQSLIELLHDEDPDVRIFASDILGSSGSPMALAPLGEALLKDPEVNVRYQAAVSLGTLALPEASAYLGKGMNDEEWVQYSVIEALSKIGDSTSVDALVRSLDKASDLVASMIVDALGEIGNVKAVNLLLKRMDSVSVAMRNKIVKAVVGILGAKSLTLLSEDEREKFRQYMLVALEDEDEDVQNAAMRGLSFVGGEDASAAMLNIAEALDPDQDTDRRGQVIDCLARIGLTDALAQAVDGDNLERALVAVEVLSKVGGQDVVDVLTKAFWKAELELQRAIISVVEELGGEADKDFFLRVLDEHADGKVIKASIRFLGVKLRLAEAEEKLFALTGHQYDDVKEAALEACIAIDGLDMIERFKAMAESQEPIERLMAIYAIGRFDMDDKFDYLNAALSDEVPDIRKVALDAMSEQCQVLPPGLDHLRDLLDDPVREVRLTVVELLGKCYGQEAVPMLLAALDDEDDWVRIRAVEAFGAHKEAAVVPRLVELAGQGNQLVSIKVVETLGAIGGSEAFSSLLTLSNSPDPDIVEAAEAAIEHMRQDEG